MNSVEFHICMLTLATRYSFSETSGRRSEKRNKAVGGSENSRHLLMCARDVVLDDEADTSSFKVDAQRLNLTVIDEGDHLHVQVK
jgi:hypothetical protein